MAPPHERRSDHRAVPRAERARRSSCPPLPLPRRPLRALTHTPVPHPLAGAGGAFGLYEGAACDKVAPAFIVGMTVLGIFLLFAINMTVMIVLGDKGAPWIFNKNGENKNLNAIQPRM